MKCQQFALLIYTAQSSILSFFLHFFYFGLVFFIFGSFFIENNSIRKPKEVVTFARIQLWSQTNKKKKYKHSAKIKLKWNAWKWLRGIHGKENKFNRKKISWPLPRGTPEKFYSQKLHFFLFIFTWISNFILRYWKEKIQANHNAFALFFLTIFEVIIAYVWIKKQHLYL